MVKSILLCVEDGFDISKPAIEWASQNLVNEGCSMHIVTVIKTSDYISPAVGGPMAAFDIADTFIDHYVAQKLQNELKAAETLKQASELVRNMDLNLDGIECHALNATGGASGVAESLVKYANTKQIGLAVLGSRGGGALQRSLRSVIGLGSVSDYAVHNMHCPVLIVRQGCLETFAVAQPPEPADKGHGGSKSRSILVACDETPQSKAMMQWMLENVVTECDDVHVVSVAKPMDYSIIDPVIDTSTAFISFRNSEDAEVDKKEHLKKAEQVAKEFVEQIKSQGIPLDKVWYKALQPEGGASGVGESLLKYASANGSTMIVVGNRDLGFFKRAMTSMIGLDSVSEHLAHNAPCPVLVFKH